MQPTLRARIWVTIGASLLVLACETKRTVIELGSPPSEELVATITVDLDGQQIRPYAQDTEASGRAMLTFMRLTSGFLGGDIIQYKMHFDVTAQSIDSVTSVHIHGPSAPDTIAPILAVLFENVSGTGPVDGQLVSDSIPHSYGYEFDDDRLAESTNVEDVLDLTSQALLYVDIHTRRHPDGEIRGNVR